MSWNSKKNVWEYRVKDLQGTIIGWFTERQLDKIEIDS